VSSLVVNNFFISEHCTEWQTGRGGAPFDRCAPLPHSLEAYVRKIQNSWILFFINFNSIFTLSDYSGKGGGVRGVSHPLSPIFQGLFKNKVFRTFALISITLWAISDFLHTNHGNCTVTIYIHIYKTTKYT